MTSHQPNPTVEPSHGAAGQPAWRPAADGRVAVIELPDGPVRLPDEVVRRVATAQGVEVLLVVAPGTRPADVDRLARTAVSMVSPGVGVATLHPVVDALKRVDGSVVTATLDRTALRRVVPPAAVHLNDLTTTPMGDLPRIQGWPAGMT